MDNGEEEGAAGEQIMEVDRKGQLALIEGFHPEAGPLEVDHLRQPVQWRAAYEGLFVEDREELQLIADEEAEDGDEVQLSTNL